MNDPEIQKKLEYFKFAGRVVSVIEDYYKASLSLPEKERENFITNLLGEYAAAGKPKKVDAWIIERLQGFFPSVGDAPKWVEDLARWPWLSGKPMIFLGQLSVPDNDVVATHASKNTVLYVFGARVPTSGGWKMEYRVMDQRTDLKGLVAVVDSESPPHTPANTKLMKRKQD